MQSGEEGGGRQPLVCSPTVGLIISTPPLVSAPILSCYVISCPPRPLSWGPHRGSSHLPLSPLIWRPLLSPCLPSESSHPMSFHLFSSCLFSLSPHLTSSLVPLSPLWSSHLLSYHLFSPCLLSLWPLIHCHLFQLLSPLLFHPLNVLFTFPLPSTRLIPSLLPMSPFLISSLLLSPNLIFPRSLLFFFTFHYIFPPPLIFSRSLRCCF